MRTEKKDRERLILSEVAKLYDGFPEGELRCHESPDFLIPQEACFLGVEIVDYVRGQSRDGSPKRNNESRRQRIVDAAQKRFEAAHSAALVVYFYWLHRRALAKADTKPLAMSAALAISEHIPANPGSSTRIERDELEGTPIHGFVHSINVIRVTDSEAGLWTCVEGGPAEVGVDEIQRLINEKSEEVPKYRKHCDAVWLIIVAGGEHISSIVSFTEELRTHPYQSKFSRVLFYDRVRQKVLPLVLRD